MVDYGSAAAKLRGLELITEAAADRRAASLRRTRRKRDRHGERTRRWRSNDRTAALLAAVSIRAC